MADVFGKRVVCIVDDDANIRRYTVKFESEGFGTVAALNGEDGLALIKSQHPDVVLLDLQMPVKDGVEVLESLKRDPALSRIPVVVLEQSGIIRNRSNGLVELDATRFISNPLTTPQKAVDVVREVLH